MHISFDTNDLSELDRDILRALSDNRSSVTETVVEPPKAEPPKPKGAAKKAAAVKKDPPAPEPEPEEKPEPMAEEPVAEEPEDEVEEEEQSDEDLLALAVKKASDMVAGGDAAKVRAALNEAGASRVRELNKDNVREFFKALS